jgi:hypothetical protein
MVGFVCLTLRNESSKKFFRGNGVSMMEYHYPPTLAQASEPKVQPSLMTFSAEPDDILSRTSAAISRMLTN